jgi:hypothetical protein
MSWKDHASDKQLAYIENLLDSKQVPSAVEQAISQSVKGATRQAASSMIEELREFPWKPRDRDGKGKDPKPSPEELPAGRYALELVDEDKDASMSGGGVGHLVVSRRTRLFKVWRGTRNPSYVKVIEIADQKGGEIDIPWAEQLAVMKQIVATGIAKAAELYGLLTGDCGRCAAHLTNALSRLLLIGPECIKHVYPEPAKTDRVTAGRKVLRDHGVDPYEDVPEWLDLTAARKALAKELGA